MAPRSQLATRTFALLSVVLGASPALAQEADLEPGLYAQLDTSRGTMVLRLHHQHAPRTVGIFVGLIRGTQQWVDASEKKVKRPYYDGLTFHRVIAGFMIQGGDPKADGTGGPGFAFRDETTRSLRHDAAGVLSMANSDPRSKPAWANAGKSNGSQFFITLAPTPNLDGRHTVFGRLVKGLDVLQAIGQVKTGKGDKPVEPVVIKKAGVKWIPRKAPAAAKGDPDPKKLPGKEQPAQDVVRVQMICVQFAGCERQGIHVKRSKKRALALARRLVTLCRQPGADTGELAKTWSDVAPRAYELVREGNDPSLEPVYHLQAGQVSDPVMTPYGVVIAEAR